MNIAIVEDEISYKEQLLKCLRQYETDKNAVFNITIFSDGMDITENYSGNWDIIFLDIKMNLMDGLEAAQLIRNQDSKVILIFITSMVQFAVNGYEVDALDFVVKPITYPKLKLTMDKASARINSNANIKYLMLPSINGIKRVSTDELLYIEVRQHNLYYYTESSEYVKRETMKSAVELLSDYNFVRCNNSFLVNLKNVTAVQGNEVIIGKYSIPLSRSKKKDFIQNLSQYLLDGSHV